MKKRYIALIPAIALIITLLRLDKKHVKSWCEWQKNCKNNWFNKFLVLIQFIASPTLELQKSWEDVPSNKEIIERLNKKNKIYAERFKKDKKYNVIDIIEKQLTEIALERSKQFADDLQAMKNDEFVDLINDKRDLINEVQGEVYDE